MLCMAQLGDYLSTNSVAEMYGVARQTVYRWAKAGLIPCQRTPGGIYRFPRAEVEAQFAGETKPSEEAASNGDARGAA
jgi:excisionase family DNA binding protein